MRVRTGLEASRTGWVGGAVLNLVKNAWGGVYARVGVVYGGESRVQNEAPQGRL